MQSKWHIIRTENELSQLIQACKTTKYASVDFETNGVGLYMQSFIPTILSVSFEAGSGYSIPLAHFEMPEDHPWLKWLTKFGRQVMEDPDIVKLGWNVKFDYQIFHKYHIYPKGTTIDGMLSKYLLDENRPHGLKDMVRRYLPQFADYENSIKDDEETRKVKWDSVPLEELCRYGCLDVDCTLRLCLFFEKKLMDNNLYHILRHLYMPMSKVIQETEENGMTLDIDFNNQLLESYKTKIDQLREDLLSLSRVKKFHKWYSQERIDKYIDKLNGEISSMDPDKESRKIAIKQQKIAQVTNGVFTTREEQALIRPINLNSIRDLAMILYSDKGMGFECKTYTNTGNPSTAEDTLTDLRLTIEDPNSYKAVFLDKLADLRATSKMYTTYIEGWHDSVQDDGKLHGSFLLHGTTSGRLSCKNPNLQQLPKTSVDPNIKKQIIPEPRTLYMVMDFSQAELRIMTYLSKDQAYLKAFKEGQDPHLAIAAQKYGVDYREALKIYEDETHPDYKLWKVRRKQAKQIVFGIIYGITAGKLAEKLSEPREGLIVKKEEAEVMMDDFFEQHPKIKKFTRSQERLLRKQGYIETLFGTKRRLPEIYSDDRNEVAYAIRLAVNTPCQGAASHMTQFGAILNFYDMRQGKFPPMKSVATVHDSFYYNVLPKNINVYTLYLMWDLFRNPETEKYFGFKIDTIDMSMDFNIGRNMAEELPFIPGYDYNKMLLPDFTPEAYLEEHKRVKAEFEAAGLDMVPKNYAKMFPQEFDKWKSMYGQD